jgi:MFS family permease
MRSPRLWLGSPSRYPVLVLVTAAHALGAVSVLAIAPLSPLLLDDLGLTRAQVGLFLPALYLGGILMSLPAGWLTDRLGARITLAAGQCLTGLMVGLAAWSAALPVMLPLFCLAGLGWAVINPTTGKAILERFPSRERGFAMGVKQTGLTLGGVAASVTMPVLALTHGWRAALTVAAVASLVSAAGVLGGLRGSPRSTAVAPVERARFAEVLPFLTRPAFATLLACGLTLSLAQSSVLAYLALFARESLGLSVVAGGGLLAVAQAGGTAGRLGWGIVSDRMFGGRRRPGVIVNAMLGAGAYLVFASGVPLGGGATTLVALVAGVGAFGWVGLYLALAAEVGGPRHAGLLTGVAVSCSWSGVLLGPPLFGALLEATGSYHWPWLALAATSVAAAVALYRLPPLVKR